MSADAVSPSTSVLTGPPHPSPHAPRLAQDPEKYQFVGCIDPGRVTEVQGAVGQYRNEHASLAHFAAGHDAPLPHGEQWLYQHK